MDIGGIRGHCCYSRNWLLNTGVCLLLSCDAHLVSEAVYLSVGGQVAAGLCEGQHCTGISVGDQGRASL